MSNLNIIILHNFILHREWEYINQKIHEDPILWPVYALVTSRKYEFLKYLILTKLYNNIQRSTNNNKMSFVDYFLI